VSNKFDIFQYISLVRFKGIPKLLDKIKNKNYNVILDLEDSSKDIFSPKNTLFLKNQCRLGLDHLNKKKIKYSNIFLRINGIKSKFYEDDIKSLHKNLNKNLNIKGIFIPKIEEYSSLLKINKILKLNKKKIKLIPIIESKKGYNNLEKILAADRKNKLIFGVHYGHFDYCLNNKFWPFPEPFHKEYWEIIFPIIRSCQKFKKKFIQTPYPLINNPKLFYKSITYIKNNFNNLNLALSLVNFDNRFLRNKLMKKDRLIIKKMSQDKKYKIKFANKIIKNYLATKKSKKSFSLSNKRFIPPHQFISAKFFISRNAK
jgi:citrate lyase beta subunit